VDKVRKLVTTQKKLLEVKMIDGKRTAWQWWLDYIEGPNEAMCTKAKELKSKDKQVIVTDTYRYELRESDNSENVASILHWNFDLTKGGILAKGLYLRRGALDNADGPVILKKTARKRKRNEQGVSRIRKRKGI